MGVFTNFFRQEAKGLVGKAMGSGLPGSSFLRTINDLRSNILDKQGRCDSIVMAMVNTSDLICDKMVEDEVLSRAAVTARGDIEYCSIIPQDLEDIVVNGLYEGIENNTNHTVGTGSGVTLTDVTGKVYELRNVHQQIAGSDTLAEHRLQSIISYVDNPASPKDCLIFEDISTGKKYFNNIIYSKGQNTDVTSIWSVVRGQMESVALNDAIVRAIDALRSAGSKVKQLVDGAANTSGETGVPADSILLSMQDCFNSKYPSVKQFANGISIAYQRQGFIAACAYIIQYVSAASTIRSNNDTLEFTDNGKLVPSQYIAGMVFSILSTVAQVAAVIVTAFSKILGAITFVAGGIIGAIGQVINMDKQSTLAAMNESNDAILPIGPMGFFKGTLFDSDITNPDVRNLIDSGESYFYFYVPGGYILLGPGSMTNNGVIYDWNVEFHPSCDMGRECIEYILDTYNNEGKVTLTYEGASSGLPEYSMHWDLVEYDAVRIADMWNTKTRASIFENLNNGRLLPGDDTLLERNFWANTAIFTLYLSCFNHGALLNTKMGYFYSDSFDALSPVYKNAYTADNVSGPLFTLLFESTHTKYFYVDVNGATRQVIIRSWSSSSLEYPSWATSLEALDYSVGGKSYGNIMTLILNTKSYGSYLYFDAPQRLPSNLQYCCFLPKYDASTFVFWVVTAAVVSAILVAVTVVATIAVRKAIIKKRAQNTASVEAAWDRLKGDPNAENYASYRKAAKRNNRWAALIGGSKFSLDYYWSSDSGSSSSETVSTGLSSLGDLLDQESTRYSANEAAAATLSGDDLIRYLIAGPSTSSNPS